MNKKEKKEIFFLGISGRFYPFRLYPLNTDLPDIGAVYIFTKMGNNALYEDSEPYEPLYIGQTGTLKSCVENHEKLGCAGKLGMNSICVHLEPNAEIRVEIEQDLLGAQKPPCNDS